MLSKTKSETEGVVGGGGGGWWWVVVGKWRVGGKLPYEIAGSTVWEKGRPIFI